MMALRIETNEGSRGLALTERPGHYWGVTQALTGSPLQMPLEEDAAVTRAVAGDLGRGGGAGGQRCPDHRGRSHTGRINRGFQCTFSAD